LWCSHTVHHPQGELAKFGYRSEMKVENFKNPAVFWPPVRTYCLKTMVPFQVWHKLNNFLICRIFWILIVSYDKNLKDFKFCCCWCAKKHECLPFAHLTH
jgi:hypothetical protein